MIGGRGHYAPARRALQETDLQQIGFVYVLNSLALFSYRSSDGIEPDRSAAEGADHRLQHLVVDAVQSARIYLKHLQRFSGNLRRNNTVAADLRIIAHPLQETVGNPRSPTARRAISSAASPRISMLSSSALRATMKLSSSIV